MHLYLGIKRYKLVVVDSVDQDQTAYNVHSDLGSTVYDKCRMIKKSNNYFDLHYSAGNLHSV